MLHTTLTKRTVKSYAISIDSEKTLEKFNIHILFKNLYKLSANIIRDFFNLIRGIGIKPAANFMFNGERQNVFHLGLRLKKSSLLLTFIQHCTRGLIIFSKIGT